MTEPKKDSGKILDALKGLLTVSKTGKKETAAKPTEIKATGTAKPTLKSTTKPPVKPAAKPVIKPAAGVSKPPAQNLRVIEAKQALEKQAEVLHSGDRRDQNAG
jgi:hypothetical protein